jgi:hypothetical protein
MGTSVWRSVVAGRKTNILALAYIFSTIVALDSPLVQRASKVVAVPWANATGPLHAVIEPEIPRGYTGKLLVVKGHDPTWPSKMNTTYRVAFAEDFIPLFQVYAEAKPMKDFIHGCERKCSATIQAPALKFRRRDMVLNDTWNIDITRNSIQTAFGLSPDLIP